MCGIWAVFGSNGDIACQCNSLKKIAHRGPDGFRIESINSFPNSCVAFYRLAIMDDLHGMQPIRIFQHPHVYLMYNGEIYNYNELQKEFGFPHYTECDGESIIHLYAKGGIEFAAKHLDGVFAFCLMDTANRKVYIGRDAFGVRPVFRIATVDGFLALCSEAKGLIGLSSNNHGTHTASQIEPVLPGYVETYSINANGKASLAERTRCQTIGETPVYSTFPVTIGDDIKQNIRELLTMAVRKRLMGNRRIGCLLSGGLDSSLLTALAVNMAKDMGLNYKIQTFTIGTEGSTDVAAARKVAKYLGTEHHEILLTLEQGIRAVEDVIYHLECYDTITIRGSIAMYLASQYIKDNTDSTIILSGEGSDEVTEGYIHFNEAPSAEEASAESQRLCNDLYMFDVLRVDRTTAAWGLEVRVPFLDHRFSSYYMSLPDKLKLPTDGIEKHLLRSAFSDQGLLPDEIIWRPKEGLSDGISPVEKSWYTILQDHINKMISDEDLNAESVLYTHNKPSSKESLHYRKLFEKYYPDMGKLIPYFWMPKWTKPSDPSSRCLQNYKQ